MLIIWFHQPGRSELEPRIKLSPPVVSTATVQRPHNCLYCFSKFDFPAAASIPFEKNSTPKSPLL